MTRTAVAVGIISGIIITVAGTYPLVGLLAPLAIPGWQTPVNNELVHSVLLMLSAVVAVPVFFFGGAAAAVRGGSRGWTDGLRAGLLAGATAATGCYLTLVSPLNALVAYGAITPHLPDLAAAMPLPPSALLEYVAAFDDVRFSLEMTLLVFAVVWGSLGALAGHRRRHAIQSESRPVLYKVMAAGDHPRLWFAGDETALATGLRVGVAVGLLALVTTFGWFYAGFAQELPQFEAVISESRTGMVTGPLSQTLSILSPLLVVALLGFGFLIVALVKNPRDRIRARSTAIIMAAVIIVSFLTAVGLRILYFNLGLAPFMLSQALRDEPGRVVALLMELRGVLNTLAVPDLLVTTTLLIAWSTVLLAVIAGILFGLFQALLSVGLVPLIRPRPVDRAVLLQRQIRKNPDEVLPILYDLCATDAEAYDVLAHLAVATHKGMPAVSKLAAAYHTLGCSPYREDHLETVDAVQAVLHDHASWRWSRDFALVYRTVRDVLAARTLEEILLIRPSLAEQTSSLPPRMVQSMQHINRIINELQKSKKIADLPTQLIFLENGLAAIHDGQRFVNSDLQPGSGAEVTLPQRAALAGALDHWQGVVLAAVKRLKGRADLVSRLENQLCTHCNPMPLVWQIENQGLNVAQEVRLRVLPGRGYEVGVGEAEIEILPPGEARQVTLSILPEDAQRRLRVEWEILYDDAVVDDRRLTFADMVEFAAPATSFTRIFPIPYVTGTPLKTDDVFVGREDVFTFIQENLVGSHQNNVIILHGQRRTGKTSVLYRLGRVMDESHIGILIDMQGKPARGEADFLYSIADDIVFALEDEGIQIELPSRATFEEAPEFVFRARFLRDLYPRLNGKHLLLMFDEFEELQRRVESGRLQPEIFQFLRNLMQHEEKLDFVFSGTHRLEDLSADYWSILFNIAAYKPVTFLSAAEVRRLMTTPVAQFHVEYDPLAVERVINVAAGHPYFTQLILHELMVYHNEVERDYLTAADVDQVVERILERGEAHFKHIWAESSAEEQDILKAAAELLHSANVVHWQDVQAFLESRGRRSADGWNRALASLTSREILSRSDAKRSLYCFRVDLIRLWIDRTRPSL